MFVITTVGTVVMNMRDVLDVMGEEISGLLVCGSINKYIAVGLVKSLDYVGRIRAHSSCDVILLE